MTVDLFAAIDGSRSGTSYIVNYDEDLWNSFDKESQEYCWQTWLKKAKQSSASVMVLRLHPDELFPAGEHEHPYVARQESIAANQTPYFAVEMRATITVDTSTKFIEPSQRAALNKMLGEMPADTRYTIQNRDKLHIESGRV